MLSYRQLEDRPCEIYPNDMRVWLPQPKRYVYPDLSIVCGEPQFGDDYLDNLLNPLVVSTNAIVPWAFTAMVRPCTLTRALATSVASGPSSALAELTTLPVAVFTTSTVAGSLASTLAAATTGGANLA